MTDRSVYRVKVKDQIVIVVIGLVIASIAAVAVFVPDSFDPGTSLARTAQRLAPLLLLVGLVTAAQPILRIQRRILTVDDVGINSPFYWSLDRGSVRWSEVDAIEPIGAPYGSKRGLHVRVRQGRGIVVPVDLVEDGERLEEDLYRRLGRHQASGSPEE